MASYIVFILFYYSADDPLAKCPYPPDGVGSKKIQGAVRPRRVGGVMEYECRKRFPNPIAGETSLTCREDGTWSGYPLQCEGKYVIVINIIL